ncbi:DNA 3'-5' helicase OS=Streptomyces albaduncus OX=68172 GN=FHS32_003134 PE=4 SV=1 [Streptomyces griseoloalbus]
MLGLLLDEDETLLARVDVTTVDAYANGVVRAASATAPKPVGDREQRQLWEKVVKQLDLPFTARFLAQEYRHVVLAQDLRDLDAYLAASRRGRGTGLGPARRREVWGGVERFERLLRDRGETTHLAVCARAAGLLADGPASYAHVVVDEAQDLHPAQWRVLRAAAAPGPDDLFLTGDPHQQDLRLAGVPRLPGHRHGRPQLPVAGQLPLDRGDSRLVGAAPQHVTVDALDGEGTDSLAGYRSLLRGGRQARGYATRQEDLVDRVRELLDEGLASHEIGVCARFNLSLDSAEAEGRRDTGAPRQGPDGAARRRGTGSRRCTR